MTTEIVLQGGIETAIENGIGTISFHHPKSNSLPSKVLKELAETITAFGNKEEVKVIVLKSEGNGAFCAGASFDELLTLEEIAPAKEFFMGFARVINAIRKAPKFVIGRVQGKAVGGGVGVACSVDYCLATEAASVKLSELAVGIGPFVVGPAVERKMGTSAFDSLAINATEWRDAAWAKEKGMFMDIYPTTEAMDEALAALAKRLSSSSPDAMKELKAVMWKGTEDWDTLLEQRAMISGRLILSDFAKQTIQKIKQG
jgi:methylglutaconyl-CoA hydratase